MTAHTPGPALGPELGIQFVYLVQWDFSASKAEREAFDEWYSGQHLPRILGVPGFLGATVYSDASDGGDVVRFATAYDISSPAALASPEYLSLPGWEGWGRYVSNWQRRVFQLHQDLRDRGRNTDASPTGRTS